ncbi:DUF551 domain-containing protein [Citrobacter braakii]|uniref:DUF551 domain-containing protein n=1 Tax=Citrobacter braakii TaxID=57706 RepID=UPI0030801823
MTTNNHPANGPVSLDRLHQIREILSKAAAQSDGGNLGYAMADAVKVIDGAIAAFGAEPVAYMTYKGYLLHAGDPKVSEYSEPTPLYTAPPAPVVPDDVRQALCIMDDEIIAELDAEESASRAAMLQAGNSPVTPDGWIPVSEQMPEGMQTVITSNGFDIGQGWWDGEAWTSFDCHDVVPGKVTHWMPLPASPHFREIGNSSTNNCRENAKTSTNQASLNSNVTIDCWCHTCRPVTMSDMRFVVCPDCGNKRCPHANDHRNDCTGSNEPGQIGSAYQAAPKQGE